jgi:hypothetical protein
MLSNASPVATSSTATLPSWYNAAATASIHHMAPKRETTTTLTNLDFAFQIHQGLVHKCTLMFEQRYQSQYMKIVATAADTCKSEWEKEAMPFNEGVLRNASTDERRIIVQYVEEQINNIALTQEESTAAIDTIRKTKAFIKNAPATIFKNRPDLGAVLEKDYKDLSKKLKIMEGIDYELQKRGEKAMTAGRLLVDKLTTMQAEAEVAAKNGSESQSSTVGWVVSALTAWMYPTEAEEQPVTPVEVKPANAVAPVEVKPANAELVPVEVKPANAVAPDPVI